MGWKIPLFKIYWGKDDVISVSNAIKKEMFLAVDLNIEKFEKRISTYIGTKVCV